MRDRPDFWHTSFGPLVEKVRLEKGNKHLESEFFDSLSNFARLYSLDLPQKESFGFFPTNIDAGFLLASEHLKRINPKAHLELVTSDDGAFCLCSYSFADKSYELYHLGLNEWIAPLLNQPLTLEVSLLASVLAYLIQVAGVPFYGNKTSFAAWQYEAVKDYFEEQILEMPDFVEAEKDPLQKVEMRERAQELTQTVAHINQFQTEGTQLYNLLSDPTQLTAWHTRYNAFSSQTVPQTNLKKIAGLFLALYEQYPNESINTIVAGAADLMEDEQYIEPEAYIGIYAALDDDAYSEIVSRLECDMQEVAFLPPLRFQCHDVDHQQPDIIPHFADQFYQAMEQLSDFL